MFRRAQRAVVVAVLTLIPGTAMAQTVWQPAPPPTVTAETTSWYLANEPITINGEPYYPSGAIQFFNGFQMVRSGSFNGIPLYIDPGFKPGSMILVPLSGQRHACGNAAGGFGCAGPRAAAGRHERPDDRHTSAHGVHAESTDRAQRRVDQLLRRALVQCRQGDRLRRREPDSRRHLSRLERLHAQRRRRDHLRPRPSGQVVALQTPLKLKKTDLSPFPGSRKRGQVPFQRAPKKGTGPISNGRGKGDRSVFPDAATESYRRRLFSL